MPNVRAAIGTTILGLAAAQLPAHANPAVAQPRPWTDREWHALARVQRDRLSLRRADVCLIGDSLTQFWGHLGRKAWDQRFKSLSTVNCGIAADRVEHILYRVEQLGLAKARPRVAVVLAGTNNVADDSPDSPEAIAKGCEAIVATIQKQTPETVIVLVALPPSGAPGSPTAQRILDTNRALARLASDRSTQWLDLHAQFVDEHGHWKEGFSPDGTHLSAKAYEIFAKTLEPLIVPYVSSSMSDEVVERKR